MQLPQSRAALAQLEKALQRLEGAVQRRNGDLFLNQELRTAREDYARLDKAARQVEARLGSVIDHLKTIVED